MTEGPARPAGSRRSWLVAAGAVVAVFALVVVAWPVSTSASLKVRPRLGREVPVTAMDQSLDPANNSPTLLADPADDRFVVLANRLDAPDFSCALHLSGDGGRSWTPSDPVPRLPEGAEKCYAPEVAFDRSGILYYLFVGLAGRGNEPMGAFLTMSSDRGQSFTAPQQVLGPLNFAVRMAIDPDRGDAGRLHLVWIKATSDPPTGAFGPPPNPILTKHSDDGGLTFSEPVQVNDPRRLRVVAPALALGPDHRVYVSYYDLKRDAVDYHGLEGPVWEGGWELVLAASQDGGREFSHTSVIEDSIAPPERVMLIFTMAPSALAVQESRICAAWSDARRGDPDVFARCSGNGGRQWGPLRRLNDDPLGNGLSQFMPRLAFSPGGRLDAMFYDRRREPHNVLNYVFFTFSVDGGQRWARNVRLTRHASNSRIGQQYANPSAEGLVEFGSRMGLVSHRSYALAAWADTRNSRPESTGQDIFTRLIEFQGSNDRPSWPWIAAGILAVLGAASIATGVFWRRVSPTPGGSTT